jgi:hypothetical protein
MALDEARQVARGPRSSPQPPRCTPVRTISSNRGGEALAPRPRTARGSRLRLGPARHRDDAERAEEVAALLHLEERARLARERPRAERRHRALAPAVADDHCGTRAARDGRRPARRAGSGRSRGRRPPPRPPPPAASARSSRSGRRARPGFARPRAARQAAALGVRGVGHRARVHDHDVGPSSRSTRRQPAPTSRSPIAALS